MYISTEDDNGVERRDLPTPRITRELSSSEIQSTKENLLHVNHLYTIDEADDFISRAYDWIIC